MNKIVQFLSFLTILVFVLINNFLYSGEILFEVKDNSGNPIMSVQDDGIRIMDSTGVVLMTVNSDSIRFGIDAAMQRSFAVQQSGDRQDNSRVIGSNVFKVVDDTEVTSNYEGPMMLWYPRKEAFRVGNVIIEGASNVGLNSFASGYRSEAQGDYSQAMGFECISGSQFSTALGYKAETYGEGALAIGYVAQALSPTAVALGRNVTASQAYSVAIGNDASSTGQFSTAIGKDASTTTSHSLAIGTNALVTGAQSAAIGTQVKAIGNYSAAFGQFVEARGVSSTALGSNITIAHASASTAIGYNNQAYAKYSTALGYNSSAYGRHSIAAGSYATSIASHSFVIGKYNLLDGDSTSWHYLDPLFVVGNGNSTSRNNAFTIYKDGDAKLDGGLSLEVGTEVNEFSTDGTLAGNSVYVVPTERAVKTYVDAQTGPSAMIPVAIGNISSSGGINSGLGITSCSWNDTYSRYEISLTGVSYDWDTHITMITPMSGGISATTGSVNNKLLVKIYNSAGTKVQGAFQFVTYKP